MLRTGELCGVWCVMRHTYVRVCRFRVQVRTTEGVGNWSQPKEAKRAEPSECIIRMYVNT